MSATTIKDIARALGLAPSTVSRALSGHHRIPLETRERVSKAASALGYMPNRAAQRLVGKPTGGFAGLVLTDPGYGREDSYLGEFLSGLGQGMGENAMDLFLTAIPQGQSELSVIRNIVASRRADGLILGRTSEVDPRVDFLTAAGFPFVTHGRVADGAAAHDWVDTDGFEAFGTAFEMLHALGHRRFALLTIEEPMTFRLHRTEGLLGAMQRRADPEVTLNVVTSPRYDSARRQQVIHRMLTDPARPTAVLALFDGLALAVLQAAEALSLSVPRDLSVVGFDNIASAATARPALTTFDSDTFLAARDCARMLVVRMADPAASPMQRLIRPQLVSRASHGPAPA
jgi:LacI family transcriptional regulator